MGAVFSRLGEILSGDYLEVVACAVCDTTGAQCQPHWFYALCCREKNRTSTGQHDKTFMARVKLAASCWRLAHNNLCVLCFGFDNFRARCRTTTRTYSCLSSRPSDLPRELGRTPARYGTHVSSGLLVMVHIVKSLVLQLDPCRWCWTRIPLQPVQNKTLKQLPATRTAVRVSTTASSCISPGNSSKRARLNASRTDEPLRS